MEILAILENTTGMHVSARTISRRLNQVDLYARKPLYCTPLQPRHRRERLHWYKQHVGWDHQNWSRVMFSDKSRYGLTSDYDHQLLWNTLCTEVYS
ncbi:hypothetical protein TNCV_2779361 [Trichonephila clavipes]|nr:hypothetical protein TNCV_2779361 [Trichonephila clavipes]